MKYALINQSTQQETLIKTNTLKLGRKNADLIIDDPVASEDHLVIQIKGQDLYLTDSGSQSGTYLNNQKVLSHTEMKLSHGDEIKIGSVLFKVKIETPSMENTLSQSDKPSKFIDVSQFRYIGSTEELLILVFKNLILTLLTFGFYAPYAKTNLRKFIWSHTKLGEESFHFFGTGIELFKAYLKVGVLYFAFITLGELIAGFSPKLTAFIGLFAVVFYLFLYTRGRYGAHRYLMNRSSFYHIRFYMDVRGSWEYTKEILVGSLLTIVTLGFYYPILAHKLDHILWGNSQFGHLKFNYTATRNEYMTTYFTGIFLSIVTLGLYFPFFMAKLHHLKIENTSIGGLKFQSSVSGFGLFKLLFIEMLVIMISFGIAAPWVITLNIKYYLENLHIKGELDIAEIKQAPKVLQGAEMDQLMDFFDVDTV